MGLIRLDLPAYQLAKEFFQYFPLVYLNEQNIHGAFCPKTFDRYFLDELNELEHQKVLSQVLKNRGVMTKPMMEQWIQQELMEYEDDVFLVVE